MNDKQSKEQNVTTRLDDDAELELAPLAESELEATVGGSQPFIPAPEDGG